MVRLCYCGFGLAGATLSPTRISCRLDQTGNLQSLVHEKEFYLPASKPARMETPYHPRLRVYVFFPNWPLRKVISIVFIPFIFTLLFVFLKSVHLLRLSSQSSYTKPHLHPFYPRVRKWMAFQRGCSWIPASCIGSLLDLLSRSELNWKPLSSHHYGSLSPADLK